ncbi:MAG: hypothetical protein WBA07_20920 [Rivularia sp. (in: cyanobacteria)]
MTLTQLKKEGYLDFIDIADKYWRTSIQLKDNMMFANVLAWRDIQTVHRKYLLRSYLGAIVYDKADKTYEFVVCESDKGISVRGTKPKLYVNQGNIECKCPPKTKSCNIQYEKEVKY